MPNTDMPSEPDKEAPSVTLNHVARLEYEPDENLASGAAGHRVGDQDVDLIATMSREQQGGSVGEPTLSDEPSVLGSAIDAISSAIRTSQETNHTAVIERPREALQMLTADNGPSDDVQREDIDSNTKTIDAQDEAGWTALHRACEDGDLASVKMLVAAGADVNLHSRPRSVHELWNTAVQLAAMGGHADILRHLIDVGGADVSA